MNVWYGKVCSHSGYFDKCCGLSGVAIFQEGANISRGALNIRQPISHLAKTFKQGASTLHIPSNINYYNLSII